MCDEVYATRSEKVKGIRQRIIALRPCACALFLTLSLIELVTLLLLPGARRDRWIHAHKLANLRHLALLGLFIRPSLFKELTAIKGETDTG